MGIVRKRIFISQEMNQESPEYSASVVTNCVYPYSSVSWSPSEINYYNKFIVQQHPIFDQNGRAYQDWIDYHNEEVRKNYPQEQWYVLHSFTMEQVPKKEEKEEKERTEWVEDVMGLSV
jgi:hypothetical protein